MLPYTPATMLQVTLMFFLCPDFYYFFTLLPSLFAIPPSPLLCCGPIQLRNFNPYTALEAFKMLKGSEPTQVPNSNVQLSRTSCDGYLCAIIASLRAAHKLTAREVSDCSCLLCQHFYKRTRRCALMVY